MQVILLIIGLWAAQVGWASECQIYETIHPAFTLDGAHLSTGKCTTCAFCHIQGVFMGTPTTCYSCHAVNALGTTTVLQRSSKHIPTFAVTCGPVPGGCHTTTSFTPVSAVTMNHTIVAAYRCDSCHSPYTITCQYSAYNATCQPKNSTHQSHVGVDCGSAGCHTTKTFDD